MSQEDYLRDIEDSYIPEPPRDLDKQFPILPQRIELSEESIQALGAALGTLGNVAVSDQMPGEDPLDYLSRRSRHLGSMGWRDAEQEDAQQGEQA